MKLTGKNILACALGAGLLTFASGSAQAVPVGNELAIPLNAQLTIRWSNGDGKAKSARITSKDLINAIGEDFALGSVKGDQIVNVGDEEVDFELVDKHGDDILDLTDDGVIVADHTTLSESDTEGNNGSFKEAVTGIVDIEFYSAGDQDPDLLDSPNIDDNTLEFIDDSSTFTFTETGAAIKHNGKQTISITEKDGVGGEGHDFDVIDIDDLTVFGTITGNGSGTIIVP